jgi:peptide deformylase
MAIRKIAQLGEPILRRVATPVAESEIGTARVQSLIDDMMATMRDADGAGIAAPQVYESLRICVIEVRKNPRYPHFPEVPLMVLINPVVEPLWQSSGQPSPEESITMYEGCLSVSGLRGRVERPRKVAVTASDRRGERQHFVWDGVRAAIVQHEVDHLDGVLFVDRAPSRTLIFQREYDRYVPPEARVSDPS